MRERFSNILLGLVWILIAVGIICKAFGLWDFELFFDGWWTLFIIVPSFISIIKYGFGVVSTSALYVGVLFLLDRQGILENGMMAKILLPGILIIVGLNIILKNLFERDRNISDRIRQMPKKVYGAVFAGSRIVYPPEEFCGAEMNAIFGGLTVDLRNTTITEDVVIDVSSVFGGVTVYLPQNVTVKRSAVCLFGGISGANRRGSNNGPTVYIDGQVLFGGVTLL